MLLVIALSAAGTLLFLRPPAVTVLTVQAAPLHHRIVASGRVRTPERVQLAAQLSGRVDDILVREGEQVADGQVLITLDAREWQAQAEQAAAAVTQAEAQLRRLHDTALPNAEAAVRQAEANLRQAERQHARSTELVARGFYSEAQLDDSERLLAVNRSLLDAARVQRDSQHGSGSEVAIARSVLAQAQATLALAETRLDHTRVQAPAAATVLTRNIEPGDSVQAGQPLLTLAPHARTELTAHIDEKNLAFLQVGQQALASADAYPDARFPATLSYIAPSVDPLRGAVEIRLQVSEPPAYLRHEMTVSIDIETRYRADAIHIPRSALGDADGAQPWVLRVRDGKALPQPVGIGLRSNEQVEIGSGLSAGEQIIADIAGLTPGQRVRLRQP